MAYLYRKNRSPFWYVVYFDTDRKEVHRSTGLRADNPNDTAKAKALRAELEAKEHHRVPVVNSEGWDTWVPKYLERHCESPLTLERYNTNWKWLSLWLQTQRFHSPRAITYRNALEYVDWRTTFKKKSGKTVGRNTAIMELKLFAMIMGEAVRLGHADANPLVSLKLRRDKSPKKPEMTDKEISQIREALKEEPEWMQVAFDIALHTGCRLRETRLPMTCIDFKENKITFPAPKGGEDRAFSVPMPSALRPLFERLRKTKQKFTLEFPFQPSRRWQQFFIKIKKPHLCFHCLRVTYVNRLRRAGVPREAAMRLVNHSSELIHQVYQREKVEDVAQWRDAVQFPE
ncbi:MAG TPA: tyrosine-type recombinase/integrase [Verrucomicrobiae bacterium]|jgi:integrase|nr:tyrosine-type recombinase/integrase [Verrucomicrobiae bacterium]